MDRDEQPQGLLIADSDVLVRHAIGDYLRDCGYRVIEAATYDEALVVLESATFEIDCVLADAELAGSGNGFALRAWLSEHRPGLAVLLAGSIEAAARSAGDLCEDGPHLARPYDSQIVVDRVRRLMAKRER